MQPGLVDAAGGEVLVPLHVGPGQELHGGFVSQSKKSVWRRETEPARLGWAPPPTCTATPPPLTGI